MKDWKRIAEAHGLPLSPSELDRLTPALSALEETFRPLLKDLTPGPEPDPQLHVDEVTSGEECE